MRGCAVLVLLLSVFIGVGIEGSRAYRAHYQQNVHDEVSLLLHDVLSRAMPVSEQEHNLEIISERVREWRREQGLNTPEESDNDWEELWGQITAHLPYILWSFTVVVGTVLYYRGLVTATPPETQQKREPLALPGADSSPFAIGEGTAEGASQSNSPERRKCNGEDTPASVMTCTERAEERKEEAKAVTKFVGEEEGRMRPPHSPDELMQYLTNEFAELSLKDDPKSKRESRKVAIALAQLRQGADQTESQRLLAEATETIAVVQTEEHSDRRAEYDDKMVAQWYRITSNSLWILIYVWILFEIYYRGLMFDSPPSQPGPWMRMLPTALQQSYLWMQNVGWILQMAVVAIVVVFPLVLVFFVQTFVHVIPYYIVCGVVKWYLLESHEKAFLLFCSVRPWWYAGTLVLGYLCCFSGLRRLGRPRDTMVWCLAWVVVGVACLAAVFLGWYIASTDAHLPVWDRYMLDLFDYLYLRVFI